MNTMFKLLLFVILFTISLKAVPTLNIHQNFEYIDSFGLACVTDKNNSLTAQSAIKSPNLKELSNNFTLGIIDSKEWLIFALNNLTKEEKTLYLRLSEHTYELINLYLLDENSTLMYHAKSGQNIAYKEREVENPSFVFELHVKPNSKEYIALSIQSASGIFGTISLHNASHLQEKTLKELSIFLLFAGAILAIGIYAFMMFIVLKERLYIYYSLYVLLFGLLSFAFSGHMTYLLGIEQSSHFFAIVPAMSALFILLSKDLLSLAEKVQKINQLLNYIFVLLLISTLLILIDPSIAPHFIALLLSISLLTLLASSLYLAYKGDIIAKIYLSAVMLYLSSLLFFMFVSFGIIPIYHESFKYIPLLGSFFEFLLIVIALALKLNMVRKEHLVLSEKLSSTLQNYSKELEDEVSSRTAELALLHKELEHRVKNNFQTILSFLWLQQNREHNRDVITALNIVKLRIEAIVHAHTLLESTKSLQKVSLDIYIQNLLHNIEQTHNQYDISIQQTLETIEIEFNHAIILGLIVNEMLSNIYKHAFIGYEKKQSKIIHIQIKQKKNKIQLIIKDNGLGYVNSLSNGNGLTIVDELIKKLPEGNLRTRNILGYVNLLTCKKL